MASVYDDIDKIKKDNPYDNKLGFTPLEKMDYNPIN